MRKKDFRSKGIKLVLLFASVAILGLGNNSFAKEKKHGAELLTKTQIKLSDNNYREPSSPKFYGLHLTYELGYFDSLGDNDLKEIYRSWGFGDSEVLYGWYENGKAIIYPSGESKNTFLLKNIKIEYSISKKFALGFMFTPLRSYEVKGYKHMKTLPGEFYYPQDSGIFMTGVFSGNTYYLVVSYMPVPDVFLKKSTIKIGAGVGWSDIDFNIIISEKIQFSKKDLTYYGLLEYDYYFNPHLSIGLNIDYKYIPFKTDAFQSTAVYDDIDKNHNRFANSIVINFSEEKINFGGFGAGISLGFHF